MNPAGERKVERFGWTFAPGDKVMQIDLRRVFRNCRRRCTRKRRQKPVSATLTPSTAAGGADGERCTGWPAAIAATTSASSTRSNSSSWRSSAARVGDQGQQTVSFVLEADRRKIVDLPALALFEAGRSLVLGYQLVYRHMRGELDKLRRRIALGIESLARELAEAREELVEAQREI